MQNNTISYKDMTLKQRVKHVMEGYVALAVVQQSLFVAREVSKGKMTEDTLLYTHDPHLYIEQNQQAINNAVDRVMLAKQLGLEEDDTHYIDVFYEEKDKID